MKNKLKYISFTNEWSHDDLKEDFEIVNNPTKLNNLPNGEYMIRGNKKGMRKNYWVKDNIWYLTSNVKKDNGHFMTDCTIYMLFPIIKHSEYLELQKHVDKLSLHWQRNVHGYFFWLQLRETSREIKKSFLEYLRE